MFFECQHTTFVHEIIKLLLKQAPNYLLFSFKCAGLEVDVDTQVQRTNNSYGNSFDSLVEDN